MPQIQTTLQQSEDQLRLHFHAYVWSTHRRSRIGHFEDRTTKDDRVCHNDIPLDSPGAQWEQVEFQRYFQLPLK